MLRIIVVVVGTVILCLLCVQVSAPLSAVTKT